LALINPFRIIVDPTVLVESANQHLRVVCENDSVGTDWIAKKNLFKNVCHFFRDEGFEEGDA
jgi:hypothetical protein